MKQWICNWFGQVWPDRVRRLQVAAQYNDIGREALADIALRNYVFAPAPQHIDAIALARIEGRREAALEIIQMSTVDPMALSRIEIGGSDKRAENSHAS